MAPPSDQCDVQQQPRLGSAGASGGTRIAWLLHTHKSANKMVKRAARTLVLLAFGVVCLAAAMATAARSTAAGALPVERSMPLAAADADCAAIFQKCMFELIKPLDRGECVPLLQRALGVEQTGEFDVKTVRALMEFELKYHIVASDLLVTPNVWTALAVLELHCEEPEGVLAAERAVPAMHRVALHGAEDCAVWHGCLEAVTPGSSGPCVDLLQQTVLRMPKPSGVYDSDTLVALTRFQLMNGLPVSLRMDFVTWVFIARSMQCPVMAST